MGAGRALAAEAPAWSEAKWPFLIDQWGTGRAFRCAAAECGVAAELYLRPKIGFCNCATGVADDDDIDRVGGIDILGSSFAALGVGQPVTVGWMKGRVRSYLVSGAAAPARFALAIAYADKCDVVVATVVVVAGRPPRLRKPLRSPSSTRRRRSLGQGAAWPLVLRTFAPDRRRSPGRRTGSARRRGS